MWRGSVSQAEGVRRVPGGERGMSKGQVGASQVRRAEVGRQRAQGPWEGSAPAQKAQSERSGVRRGPPQGPW